MATKAPTINDEVLKRYVNREARVHGIRVHARRKSLKLTLEQVAGLAWTTPQTIHKIERGEIVARDHVRLALAFALACEVDDLFPSPKRAAVLREVA